MIYGNQKRQSTEPLEAGSPPSPPFAPRPGLTWAVGWGDPTCRRSSQGPDLSPQATVLCPEGTGDAKSHSPAFFLNMSSSPWHIVFNSTLGTSFFLGKGTVLSQPSLWKCRHFRKRYYAKAYRLHHQVNLPDFLITRLRKTWEWKARVRKEGQWEGVLTGRTGERRSESHWKSLESQCPERGGGRCWGLVASLVQFCSDKSW